MNPWSLTYEGFDPAHEGLREALCTLGNGRFATRGAAPEAKADAVHYPGTYVAGCYDRLTSIIAGHELTHEDMVNLPNWLPLTFATPGSAWFSPGTADLLRYRQELDMRHAVLHRLIRWRDPEGRITSLRQRRLVSMADPCLVEPGDDLHGRELVGSSPRTLRPGRARGQQGSGPLPRTPRRPSDAARDGDP